jgi:hypothetical protein
LSSRSTTDSSRSACFCWNSTEAFQLFLALFFADLVAFSAETLAALVLSQAYAEAFTSASKADIQARAVTKAAASKRKRHH